MVGENEMIPEYKVLEQKGIGKYLKMVDNYEKYVELAIYSGDYRIHVFENPFHTKESKSYMINCGAKFNLAKKMYKKIIEKDQIEKQNIIDKKFSRN